MLNMDGILKGVYFTDRHQCLSHGKNQVISALKSAPPLKICMNVVYTIEKMLNRMSASFSLQQMEIKVKQKRRKFV